MLPARFPMRWFLPAALPAALVLITARDCPAVFIAARASPSTIGPGDTSTVTVNLVTETGVSFSGLDLYVTYDPTYFTLGSAGLGSVLTSNGFTGAGTQPVTT